MEKKKRKNFICISEALCFVLAISALAVYYPFFLSWSNTAMVIICPILATLAAGGLGANAVIASGKNISKFRIGLSAVVTMAVFYGLQCSICLVLNNVLDIGKKCRFMTAMNLRYAAHTSSYFFIYPFLYERSACNRLLHPVSRR